MNLEEQVEGEVAHLLEVCHRQGLTYWGILRIFLIASQDLYVRAEIEYQTKFVPSGTKNQQGRH